MTPVVAVRHVPFEGLGLLASELEQRSWECQYVEAPTADWSSTCITDASLVVVLGGPIGAYEEGAYPFLTREMELIERRLELGRPTLGICLGAQLIARVLGARVYGGQHKEIGWSPLSLSPAGRASPLREVGEATSVLHWHGDTFELPEGAEHLASTELYDNQAFQWGRTTLALQFHLEATALEMEPWFVGHAHEIASLPGTTPAGLRSQTASCAPLLAPRARRCFSAWLDSLPLDSPGPTASAR